MSENYPIVHVLYNRPSARRTAYEFYIRHKDDIDRHYENYIMNKIILKDGTYNSLWLRLTIKIGA